MSTVMLKQHSVIDVFGGILVAAVVLLYTMKKVPRYPMDSSTGGIGTISCHHTD